MSKMLAKNSSKKVAKTNRNEAIPAGLPRDMVVLLGNKNSKLYREMVESAKKMGLTPVGEVFGPARQADKAVATALASKKSR